MQAASCTDVPAILADLRRLREDAAAGDGPKATVVTLNFIVYVNDAEHRAWVQTRALGVAEKHPCRMIVLDASDSSDRATVDHTVRESALGPVRSERVELCAGEIPARKLVSAVHSLSVRDIPTVLWWTGGSVVGEPAFAELLALSTSVLVDSSGTSGDPAALRDLGRFFERNPLVRLRDLAYMRLAPWQDVVAQFFDEPEALRAIDGIGKISIVSGSEAEALYLGAWLASRLGWRAASPASFRSRHGTEIPLTIERAGEKRRVRSVELASARTRFIATLSEGADAVALAVEGEAERPPRYTPLQNINNLSLIERAILSPGSDEIFETSLRMVHQLLG
jgi:glucose-6-phosphate dehydrogenase assembly protein OpcA